MKNSCGLAKKQKKTSFYRCCALWPCALKPAYWKQRSPCTQTCTGARVVILSWQRLTLPPLRAVPSALRGLTSLFGMGRGGPSRYSHQQLLKLRLPFGPPEGGRVAGACLFMTSNGREKGRQSALEVLLLPFQKLSGN